MELALHEILKINFKKEYNYYIYEYVGTDICMYHLINPVPRCIFQSHIPD